MHIIPVMEFVDFFEELSRRNLLHLLDRICVLAGYSSTLSCLTVCRRWSSILTEDLGSWTGILQRELRRNPENVGKIAALLGWDQPGSNISQAQAFWIHTDVKDIFRRDPIDRDNCRYFFSGTSIMAFLIHNDLLICGNLGGDVKIWDIQFPQSVLRTLQGHKDSVTCLSAHGNLLVSGGQDFTLRIWDLETGSQKRCLKSPMRYLKSVSFSDDFLISVSIYGAPGLLGNTSHSKAVLWKVSSWYDIEISDQIALDTPPICVMQCHHLSGNRLVYAVDNCVRVVVGSITGEHRFETLYQLQIKRSLWIQQVQIFWNLLVLQQSDGGLVFHDISSERDIEPLNLYSKGSGFKACPYGIVISDFAGNKCNIRHWEDVLFKVRADIGTELDVPFVDMETVIFSNLLIWSKGIAVVDSDKLTIANFWYRNPGEDELIDLK